MSANYWIRRTSQLLESRIDEDIVALDVDRGACFGFNATAARVWSLLEQPARFSDIRQNLLNEFRVEPDTCDRELLALLRQFEQDGLVAVELIEE